jgi:spore germination protein YaaH
MLLLLGTVALPTSSLAAPRTAPAAPNDETAGMQPTIHYEEAQRHAKDHIDFAAGGRVTVGFTPRKGDTLKVGGVAPRSLPAGRLTGRELRGASQAADPSSTTAPPPAPTEAPTETPAPTSTEAPVAAPTEVPAETPAEPSADAPTADPSASPPGAAPDASPDAAPALPDAPIADPDAVVEADPASFTTTVDESVDLAAAVSPAGLRREVFGYLPYWELSDSSTVLDYTKLSTIAYFGVGAAANGTLERTSAGKTTVGWAGWTSSRLTTVINDAHRNHTRVVLTVQSFAWSSGGATKQQTLLGSPTARATLATQIATAVRDRGADGVNLDFEPIVSGYGDEFTALVRRVRAELDSVRSGYQLTFATTGSIGNYPIEAATASGGADAIFIMGYDYRSSGSDPVGSIAPIGGPRYDITDTIRAYTARVPASKLILGVPWYGRAWSTDSDKLNAGNISGTKNGASTTSVYSTAIDVLKDHGRRYDPLEGVAWTAYRRENCTSTYGCVTPWRQLYVDDATALRAKYDLVNRYGLRGSGIWALGYDGGHAELWAAIRDKFITDTTPPRAGIRNLAASQSSESFTVSWASTDDFGVASHDLDISIDGGRWFRWLTATTKTSATYLGARGHAFAFRVRARDGKGNIGTFGTLFPTAGPAKIAVGGFGRVATDTLNARSGAGTANTIVTTLTAGDLVAFLQGPVSSGGYSWYRVAAPLTEWPVIGTTRSDLWVATAGNGSTFINAVAAPNTTTVAASASRVGGTGGAWFPIGPVRLLDTRSGNGLSGSFADASVRTLALGGRGGVPADAMAVTANLTVTGATSAGYLSVGPTMTANPSTSSINFARGSTVANGLTLRLGSGGTVKAVFQGSAGARVHAILDVTGYYRAGSGSSWYPLSPTRLLDTRTGNGLSGRLATRVPKTVPIAGRGAVPSDAVAVTGNLTITGSTGSGYVSAGPTATSTPSTSTLNFVKGQTIANNVQVRLGSGGRLALVYVGPRGTSTHAVFDVTGYLRSGSGGAEWYPIDPVRLLDTRGSNGLAGAFTDEAPRAFQLTGRGTVPVDAVAVTANLTATGATTSGYVSFGPTMSASPTTSTLNLAKGQTLANGLTLRVAAAGTVGGVFVGGAGGAVHTVLDLSGYFR